MLIAQITDMHVKPKGIMTFGKVDTARCLELAVEHLNRLEPRPDLVVITGDLTNDGQPDEYATLRDLLQPLAMPYFLIPGNHDQREHLRAAFGGQACLPATGEYLHYVVRCPPLRLLGLDTIVPGQPGGRLCRERMVWLRARLEEDRETPTVVFMHHPPFVTGIAHMDRMALENGAELAQLVQQYPQVERVLCGHLHRPIFVRWAGTVASTAPATAHQVSLGLKPDAPSRWCLEPPAALLHLWQPGTGLVSHVSYIRSFGPDHPFTDDHVAMDG